MFSNPDKKNKIIKIKDIININKRNSGLLYYFLLVLLYSKLYETSLKSAYQIFLNMVFVFIYHSLLDLYSTLHFLEVPNSASTSKIVLLLFKEHYSNRYQWNSHWAYKLFKDYKN